MAFIGLSLVRMRYKILANQVIEMAKIDQELRLQAKPGHSLINFVIYAIDIAHNYRLRQMIKKFGYPTRKMIGEKAMHSLWLLVQHQDYDLELQEECLKNCDFGTTESAHLVDRILVRKGKRQIYGTQLRFSRSGILSPHPIQNKKNVDKMRKKMRLDTLGEYLKKARAAMERTSRFKDAHAH